MRFSLVSAALVAALVGYGSTIALVLAAAQALGGSPAETASWIFAVCITKAVGSAGLSWWTRTPVVLAWSTPGAALIAATTGQTMAQGVAAFIVAGLLVVLTGLFRPLGRLVAAIPGPIAAAMLAGVLLPLCLKVAPAAAADPGLVLPVIAAFAIVRMRWPAFAVLAALATGIALAFALGAPLPRGEFDLPRPVLIAPDFTLAAVAGLAIPLYLITMAAQNLPGFAVLRSAGYEPPVGAALTVTGALSAVGALFGGHTINMAAITAAICLGDDVHPDRSERWKVGLAYGGFWLALGIFGSLILGLLAVLPTGLVATIVGLALITPLMGALGGAFGAPSDRFAAAVTLTVAASGVAVFGIGAAFWGLVMGLAVHGLDRIRARDP
jgi:benzoate membrane transport protein